MTAGHLRDPDDSGWLPDYARSADLSAAGADGLTVTVAIDPNGREHFIVLVECAPPQFVADFPPREASTGPLDPGTQVRVDAVTARHARPHMCGRRTAKGRPCRLRVPDPGEPCQFHGGSQSPSQKEAPAALPRDRSE